MVCSSRVEPDAILAPILNYVWSVLYCRVQAKSVAAKGPIAPVSLIPVQVTKQAALL